MGSLHMLEAVIVGVIMLSTVTYVVMLDGPSPNQDFLARMLKDKARDFLHIADESLLQSAACSGRTQLERLIIDGLNDNHTYWNQRAQRFFGPGVEASLLLDNGEGIYPLHEKYPFMGTTYDVPIQPDWSYTYIAPATDSLDGSVNTILETAATHYGDLIRPRGDASKIALVTNDSFGKKSSQVWALTALTSIRPATNLTWGVGVGAPMLQQVVTYSPAKPENQFYLLLSGGESPLPSNTSLRIDVPPGWSSPRAEPPSGWVSSVSGNVTAGWLVEFRLDNNPSLGDLFNLFATPPSSPVRPYDVFHARLSNGSMGESSLVVTFPSAVEHSLPRAVYPTMPYPVQLGARALIGAAFANGGPQTVVERVDIEVPGGYDLTRNDGAGAKLFANAPLDPVDTGDGNWSWVDAQHIQWRGNRTIESGKAGSWLVGALITSDASQVTSIEPVDSVGPVSRLTFENGFVDESTSWGRAPGIIRHRVPPASNNTTVDGYPLPSNAQAITHDTTRVDAETSSLLATVAGNTDLSYSLDAGDVTRLESALTNSSFEVAHRLAPLGSLLQVNADLDSLLTFVAASEYTDAQLEVEMFAPPSLGCQPTASWLRDVSALPLASIRATQIYDAEGVGLPSAFFTGDDGYVYRFDASGSPVWSQRLTGKGTALATGTFGLADRVVFVGDGQGAVTRFDAGSGAVEWRVTVERPAGIAASVPRAIVGLDVDEGRGLLLVATGDGALEVRSIADGLLVDRYVSATGYVGAAWLSSGGVLAQLVDKIERRSASLSLEHSADFSALAYTVAEPYFLVVEAERVLRLDATTLDVVGETALESNAVLAAAGEATGDSTPDVAFVQADGWLVAYNGLTGFKAWQATPKVPVFEVAERSIDRFPSGPGKYGSTMVRTIEGDVFFEGCQDEVTLTTNTYNANMSCQVRDYSGTVGQPIAIHASQGRVTVANWHAGAGAITHVDPSGQVLWSETMQNDAPTVLAHGAWGLLGDAVFIGTSQGIARVVDDATGAEVYHERATQAAGKFAFVLPVPDGGFFGSHILVAKVMWTTADGHRQTARLTDWFEVVGTDGRPVTKPIYRVVLVVAESENIAPLS